MHTFYSLLNESTFSSDKICQSLQKFFFHADDESLVGALRDIDRLVPTLSPASS